MKESPGTGLVCGACRHLSDQDAESCGNCGVALTLGLDPADAAAAVEEAEQPSAEERAATPGRKLNPLEQSGGFLDGVLLPSLDRGGGAVGDAAADIGTESTEAGVPAMTTDGDQEDEIATLGPRGAYSLSTDHTTDDASLDATTNSALPVSRACSQCGSSVPIDYKFCDRCGGIVAGEAGPPVEPEGRGVTYPAEHPDGGATEMFSGFGQEPSKTARLVVVHGEGVDGMVFGIKGAEAVAGRTTGQILFPDDAYVSPSHARFYYRDELLSVRDEGSHNGVFGRIVSPTDLDDGDHILVGEQLLRVESTRPPPDVPDGEGTYFLGCRVHGGDFRLVQLFAGSREGMVYVCKNAAVTIGQEGCDLNFPTDRFMSRRHAQVESVGGTLRLSDLSSRNGTFIRLKQDKQVGHGDHLFIGQQLLRVEF